MTRKVIALLAVIAAIGAAAYVGYRDGQEHRAVSN
jgi:hypothetical protein